MKRYSLLTALLCLCMICTVVSANEANEGKHLIAGDVLDINSDDVVTFNIYPLGPDRSDHENYTYSTSSKNEIIYISHYFNNLNLIDDGLTEHMMDVSYYYITFDMNDGSMKKCFFYSGRFLADKQYDINGFEWQRFLLLINALKTGKLVLDEEVTFEPSEWAKENVEKAIDDGLLSKANQINYKGKITRFEVCQLIYNLLEKKNIEKPETMQNPYFNDIDEECVTALFNYDIIDGKNDREFYPYDYITREEFARILSDTYRVINPDEEPQKLEHIYADQKDISDWALGYVGDMYSLNLMVGTPENQFRPKFNITKEEVITTLLKF